MQLHHLQSRTARRRGRRVGRGGKRGTTSGRGTKGQSARAGAKIRPAIRDMIKKLPKLRGYRFRPFRPKPMALDLAAVAARFAAGASVGAESLLERGLIRRMKGRAPGVKIVGADPPKKPLHIKGLAVSAHARAAIEAAGGSVRP